MRPLPCQRGCLHIHFHGLQHILDSRPIKVFEVAIGLLLSASLGFLFLRQFFSAGILSRLSSSMTELSVYIIRSWGLLFSSYFCFSLARWPLLTVSSQILRYNSLIQLLALGWNSFPLKQQQQNKKRVAIVQICYINLRPVCSGWEGFLKNNHCFFSFFFSCIVIWFHAQPSCETLPSTRALRGWKKTTLSFVFEDKVGPLQSVKWPADCDRCRLHIVAQLSAE